MKSEGAPLTVPPRWRIFPDAGRLAAAAAAAVLEAARAAIAARGVFHVVLAGGRTPLAAYARLATAAADWPRWHWYFGDERCRPAGDAARNDTAIRTAWLDRIAVPPANVHAIPAELGPDAGARRYAQALEGLGDFDLVLLGLGADGHTASLFPGHPVNGAEVLAVHAAPKPPPARVTLSAARLSRARQVLFLVTGADKRAALAAWRQGRAPVAAGITPSAGVDVWMDAEAAAAT